MEYNLITVNQIKQARNMLKYNVIAILDMDAGAGDLGRDIRAGFGPTGIILHAVEENPFFDGKNYDGIYNCRHLNTCDFVMNELERYQQKIDVIIFNFTLENYDKKTALKLLRKAFNTGRYIIINSHSEIVTDGQKSAFKFEEIKAMFQGCLIEKNINKKNKSFNIFMTGK